MGVADWDGHSHYLKKGGFDQPPRERRLLQWLRDIIRMPLKRLPFVVFKAYPANRRPCSRAGTVFFCQPYLIQTFAHYLFPHPGRIHGYPPRQCLSHLPPSMGLGVLEQCRFAVGKRIKHYVGVSYLYNVKTCSAFQTRLFQPVVR